MHHILNEHVQLFAAIEANNEELTMQVLDNHLGKINNEIKGIRNMYPQYFLEK